MASSSSNEHHRARQRPAPLARQNSSFIGAIRNIVRAPLNWFANQDDNEATPGKRRRSPVEEPAGEHEATNDSELGYADRISGLQLDSDDDGTRRSKRIRLQSPPRQHYLDPPAASPRRTEVPRRSSVIPRASSAMLPSSGGGRSTLSPRRRFPVARTMSIDPPSRGSISRRESSVFNFGPPPSSAESDYDMAVDSNGDWSAPPSPRRSPRPSFRMRSSVTPQPQFSRPPMRYISEPPPLNSLISKPEFVQAPPYISPPRTETPTLGTLAESVKAMKSPTRQSSMLFASSVQAGGSEQTDPASERALHQLDVYKTPLLPSRLRTSDSTESITTNKAPDMFNSRRRKRIELMAEDRERERSSRKGGKDVKGAVTNDTKPYAGDNPLKILLARRKQETIDEEQQQAEPQAQRGNAPVTDQKAAPPSTHTVPEPPAPTGNDWFAPPPPSSSSTEGGSSLRVGRTISSRKHFNRPSPLQRPAKSKFSAVYEEEDDNMNEAPKADPVPQLFAEPVGFSFAKGTAGPDHTAELERAKEPPLKSLPFSFAKSSPTAAANNKAPPPSTSMFGSDSSKPANINLIVPKPPVAQPKTNGMPNFFANSTLIKETMPVAPVLTFGSASAGNSIPGSSRNAPAGSDFFAPKPKIADPKIDNDKENPFWVGDSEKRTSEGSTNVFSGFGKPSGGTPTAETPTSQGSSSGFSFAKPSQPFSFDKQSQSDSSASSPNTSGGPKLNMDTPKPFSFGPPPSENKAPESATSSATGSGSIFGAKQQEPDKPNLFGDVKQAPPTGNLFGSSSSAASAPSTSFKFGAATEKPPAPVSAFASSSTAPPPQPNFFGTPAAATPPPVAGGFSFGPAATEKAAEPKPFSFGPPATEKAADPKPFSFGPPPAEKAAEPKPFSFGPPATEKAAEPKPFSFGPPATEKPAETKPFSFGAATSTPATDAPKPSLFSFGSSTTTAPSAPVNSNSTAGFGFSGGGAGVTSTSFSFGQSNAATGSNARPVTPPKSNDNEFMMEESPTRDLQNSNRVAEARPSLSGNGFSFGNNTTSTGSALFGGAPSAPSTSSGFSFGTSAPPSNPFAQKSKPAEPQGFGGFGQSAPPVAPPIQTSFSFGQTAKEPDAQRPNTAGGFGGFGTTPTSATAPTNTFSFGAPAATGSNPFGQPAASNSAPSSPSGFNQPAFSFGAPAAPAGAFSFGSQPASPASGGNMALPPSGFGAGGGFGQPAQQPSSPFGAPAMLPSTSTGAGGGLFTIGAAPPQTAQTGARVVKKLPRRR